MALSSDARRGRLLARPGTPSAQPDVAPGVSSLGEGRRAGRLSIPSSVPREGSAPLWVFFHGAGGDAEQGLSMMRDAAEAAGAILWLPSSVGRTWDVIVDDFGADVAALDSMLRDLFGRFDIDPTRVVAMGFSDGASYALSLALANGDLFTHAVAFAPGFAAPQTIEGEPRIFISHGRADPVLPVDRCSRPLVGRLKKSGYDVDYVEFDGGHTVTPDIISAALRWLSVGRS